MAVEQINLYRFACEGENCRLARSLGREAATSPPMPGLDEGEASRQLASMGWYVTPDDYGFDEILCPSCANDQATQADVEFNKMAGFKNAASQPTTPDYDPEERRIFNRLTPAERRQLHPSRLGRVATVEDARRLIAEREVDQ